MPTPDGANGVKVQQLWLLTLTVPLTIALFVGCLYLRATATNACVSVGNGASIDVLLAALFALVLAIGNVCLQTVVLLVVPRWAALVVIVVAAGVSAYLFFTMFGPAGTQVDPVPGCVDLMPTWWPDWLPTGRSPGTTSLEG